MLRCQHLSCSSSLRVTRRSLFRISGLFSRDFCAPCVNSFVGRCLPVLRSLGRAIASYSFRLPRKVRGFLFQTSFRLIHSSFEEFFLVCHDRGVLTEVFSHSIPGNMQLLPSMVILIASPFYFRFPSDLFPVPLRSLLLAVCLVLRLQSRPITAAAER